MAVDLDAVVGRLAASLFERAKTFGWSEVGRGWSRNRGVFRRVAGQDPRRRPGLQDSSYVALASNRAGEKDVFGV